MDANPAVPQIAFDGDRLAKEHGNADDVETNVEVVGLVEEVVAAPTDIGVQ